MAERANLCCIYILWLFCGFFGVHRFCLGLACSGVLYIFTFAWCGIGWLVDMCLIPSLVSTYNRQFDVSPSTTVVVVGQYAPPPGQQQMLFPNQASPYQQPQYQQQPYEQQQPYPQQPYPQQAYQQQPYPQQPYQQQAYPQPPQFQQQQQYQQQFAAASEVFAPPSTAILSHAEPGYDQYASSRATSAHVYVPPKGGYPVEERLIFDSDNPV